MISDRAAHWPNPMSEKAKEIHLRGSAFWGPEQSCEGWKTGSEWGMRKWIGASLYTHRCHFVSVREKAPPLVDTPSQHIAWHTGGHFVHTGKGALSSWGYSPMSEYEVGK